MPIPINDTFTPRGDGYPLLNAKDVQMPDGKRLSDLVLSDGKNGKTPYIGENGNWWIGEEDTGVQAAGYTPAKGTDYYTDADKKEMVAAILAELPAAEGVSF